jgi:small subunit ribosomal protein S7
MRRRSAPKREILPDPKFTSEKLAKFVNYVMRRGKKSIAEKVVYGALELAAQKINKSAGKADVKKGKGKDDDSGRDGGTVGGVQSELQLLDQALDNIAPTVEVRSRRVGGSNYQVPVEIRPSRRMALAMRWLIDAAKERSEKDMTTRLAAEILDAVGGRGIAVKKREDVHRMAKANQAYAHFRW